MIKQYPLRLISLCLLSFGAHASWYGGANLGINTIIVEKSLAYPLEVTDPTSSHFQNAWNGFHGQLIGGYNRVISEKTSLALEVDGDLFTGENRYTIDRFFFSQTAATKERFQQGIGLFILPNYRYQDTLRFFAGPGLSFSHFETRYSQTAGNIGVSHNSHKTLTGFGLKAGMATSLNNNADFLLTWQYTRYQSLTDTAIEPLSDNSLSGRYTPSANTIMAGIIIHFPDKAHLSG